jgi:XTP/dITP diphosphohydrolase
LTAGALLLATRSAGKLRELRPLFAEAGFAVHDLTDLGIPECPHERDIEAFATFEENARAKARYFYGLSRMPVVADDSGLEVPALGGAPGVHSKRWSSRSDLNGQALDDANNQKLVAALDGVADRRARYVCSAAYHDDERELAALGVAEGRIVLEGRGRLGFGYDPFFYSTELGRTFGQTSREEKERVSHRGRAMRALLAQIRTLR